MTVPARPVQDEALRAATAIVRELFRRGCTNPPPMGITLDVRECGQCADCTRDWTPEARAIVAPVLAALSAREPADEARAIRLLSRDEGNAYYLVAPATSGLRPRLASIIASEYDTLAEPDDQAFLLDALMAVFGPWCGDGQPHGPHGACLGAPGPDAAAAAAREPSPAPDEARADVEAIAAEVHRAWMDTKRAQGVESRPSEWGEEQMVPYAALSERAKDLDRGTVRAVLDAMAAAAREPADEAREALSKIGAYRSGSFAAITFGRPKAAAAAREPSPAPDADGETQ